MHLGKHEVARWLGKVIDGWLNCFAVPGTSGALRAFVLAVKRLLPRTLRRRSQKDRTDWPAVDRLVGLYWPSSTIRHPWPDRRFAAMTQGGSLVR